MSQNAPVHPIQPRSKLYELLEKAGQPLSASARVEWLRDVLLWISLPPVSDRISGPFGRALRLRLQLNRLRRVVFFISRNEETRLGVGRILRAFIEDTSALNFYYESGMSTQLGFGAELTDRLVRRWLPAPARSYNIAEYLSRWFNAPEDIEWLRRMDKRAYDGIKDLIENMPSGHSTQILQRLTEDLDDAFILLASDIRSEALGSQIRQYFSSVELRRLPFYYLQNRVQTFLALRHSMQKRLALNAYAHLAATISACQNEIQIAYESLKCSGVSVQLVYRLERMESKLERLRSIAGVVRSNFDYKDVCEFIYVLSSAHINRSKVLSLFSENFSVHSKRIVERHADIGGHYISFSYAQYSKLLRQSIGGGMIAGFAVAGKLALAHFIDPSSGGWLFLNFLNYAFFFC
jgi:site-specific recombinase